MYIETFKFLKFSNFYLATNFLFEGVIEHLCYSNIRYQRKESQQGKKDFKKILYMGSKFSF
ncbi:hypothetical protein CaldiYA01_22790 [Caldicellulosiruptor diazotrophicus]|uniref:Uncharacterized protein n=1 Tax=Caldicellulosiruptor diazotrophicus TaxID=2806205 RepID=A0ABN6EA96_9FIRM|nr:hypothetical protein CaldiYA01_22790 [Caldicellulosiruptor diazotrophicus]